jgi:tetratricopeptide (TPR) repeat protein
MSTASHRETLDFFLKKFGLSGIDDLEREYMDYVLYGLPDVGMRGYVESARLAMRDGNHDEALEAIETALELGSTDPKCHLYRGRILQSRENYEGAVVSLRRAIEMDPLNPHYHAELAGILRESEDPTMMQEGIRQYYLATEIAPEISSLQTRLDDALTGVDIPEIRNRKRMRRSQSGSGGGGPKEREPERR